MGPEVLSDISFRIPPRSFQFLTGPSGAGKTTLLRLLFMSLRPTRGLISIFGRDVAKIDRHELPLLRRRIGVVFQDFRLLDHMTTYENVALPLRVRGKDEASYRNDVVDLLKWVGLGERMHVLPPVCRAERSSARPSPGRLSTNRNSYLPTSRPAMSIRRSPAACSGSSSSSIASAPQWSSPPTI